MQELFLNIVEITVHCVPHDSCFQKFHMFQENNAATESTSNSGVLFLQAVLVEKDFSEDVFQGLIQKVHHSQNGIFDTSPVPLVTLCHFILQLSPPPVSSTKK